MATLSANHERESTQPTCQNCSTSTTPLWRRDEMGSVLCNACGLFLKLHGRPRPISLKTDVIKSRNRVKTSMRPDMAMKKKQQSQAAQADANASDLQGQAFAATAAMNARRTSQKSSNGHIDGADSPVSRTATPGMHGHYIYPTVDDPQYSSSALAGFTVSGTSPGRAASPMNGERLEIPETQEQLIATNSSLKTRVAELEVINDFIQRRLAQYEPFGGPPQEGQEGNSQVEGQLRVDVEAARAHLEESNREREELRAQVLEKNGQLAESHRRENMLKRRLDEMETEKELSGVKEAVASDENDRVKRQRVEEPVQVEMEGLAPAPEP